MGGLLSDTYKGDLKEAVRRAIGTFTGEYAFLALSRKEPDRIVGVMMGRSLAVGKGRGFCIFSSSIDSVAGPIDEWRELNREIATITKEGYKVEKVD
jgi:glucosamine 6-phosphate synthetase-like amidotransferase/phosphosugar isomerase protein